MNLWNRIQQTNRPRSDESLRDFCARMSGARSTYYVPRVVYSELVDLHDRVERLEVDLTELKAR